MTKNVWIELIGFDKNLPDYGVKNYIDNCGFVPSIVSLLLTSLDIVLFHNGYEPLKNLPKECCSYNGRVASVERDRQDWTQKDLKGLIDVLHSYGIKVMHASFTGLYGYGVPDFDRKEWLTLHPEIMETERNGEIYPMYGPLKRLENGTYFEDILFEKLGAYLCDFNFDGWHACDGWGPERMPVYYIEYSDDFVSQFCDYMKGKIDLKNINPIMEKDEKGFFSFKDDDKAKIRERADYIWENYQAEWTEFVAWRWCEFHKKSVKTLKALGKFVYVNSAWTRDPIEAYYRYGLDYKKLFDTGIEGYIVECVASASDLLFGGKSRHFTFSSALMFMKTIMPKAKLLFLHGIKDIEEQWDVLRHSPNMLKREIYALFNQYYVEDGEIKPATDGPVCCLGDSIFKDEWEWLRKNWALAEESFPKKVNAPLLVTSYEYLMKNAKGLGKSDRLDAHNFLGILSDAGSQAVGGINVKELNSYKGDILVLFKEDFPCEEQKIIDSYKSGRIIEIGCKDDNIVLSVNGQEIRKEKYVPAKKSVPFSMFYVHELELLEPSCEFLKACVKEINSNNPYFDIRFKDGLFQDTDKLSVVCNYQFIDEKVLRVVMRNDFEFYVLAMIKPKVNVKNIEIKTDFPVIRFKDFNEFKVSVPNKGIVIFDMILE